MITQTLKLNLIPGQVLPRVNVSQYDAGTRTLQMLLYNGDQAFNISAGLGGFVQGTKPDRTGFQYAATVTEGSNVVTLVVTQQMTAVSGEVTCELVIANGNDRIATVNFILYVEPAALADDTVISDTELPLIEEAAELAQRIDGIVQQVNEDAQTAAESADKAEAYGTHPPYIGANGNWYVYNVTTQQYEDSGVKAQGPLSGLTDVEITNAQDGQEITYDGTTQKWKNTSKIQTLTNQVKDMNNVLGAKNLLLFNLADIIANNTLGTWSGNNYTVSGVTYTVNNDGSITANGTATANTFIELISATVLSELSSKYGVMIMNGCPSGGGNSSYIMVTYDGTTFFTDNGEGVELPQETYTNGVRASIRNGYTAENVRFYPMIRLASITDDTYEPYAKTNQQLTQDSVTWDDLSEVGAVNMLPTDIATQVLKGATITHNSDGSYSVVKSTADSQSGSILSTAFTLKAGTYYWSASQHGHSAIGSDDFYCFIKGINGTGHWYRSTDFDVNHKWGVITLTQDSSIQFGIFVGTGTSNITFYPMITVPSYNGDYVPYAKSNKELTEDVSSIEAEMVKGGGYVYALSDYCYHMTITTTKTTGLYAKLITGHGELTFTTASSKFGELNKRKVICNLNSESSVWTYTINGLTLNLNCTGHVLGFIISNAPLTITTVDTSTPETTTIDSLNLYNLSNS